MGNGVATANSKGSQILIYDASDPSSSSSKKNKKKQKWLQGAWAVAATIRTDYHRKFAAKSWDWAFKQIGEIAQNHDIQWIEFWGHGSPGKAYIGDDVLDVNRFISLCQKYNIKSSDMVRGTWCTPLVWFRTCSSAQGAVGKQFLKGIANHLNVYAYGHCKKIDVSHMGVCCACRKNGKYLHDFVKTWKTCTAVYPEGTW
eukprot:84825_1